MNQKSQSMTLGEILGRTFVIYRSRFWTFVAIAAIPTMAMIGFLLGLTHSVLLYSANHLLGTLSICLVWLGSFFMAVLLGNMVVPLFATPASVLVRGKSFSFAEAFLRALSSWQDYLWITIQKPSLTMIVPAVVVLILILAEVVVGNVIGIHGNVPPGEWIPALALPIMGGFSLFLWIGAGLSLAIPAAALEGVKGNQALRRSWRLTATNRFRIASVWLLVFISFWIGCIILQVLLGQILIRPGSALHFGSVAEKLYGAAAMPIYAGVSSVLVPIYPIAIAIFYYDQRARREASGIENVDRGSDGVFADSSPGAASGMAPEWEREA